MLVLDGEEMEGFFYLGFFFGGDVVFFRKFGLARFPQG